LAYEVERKTIEKGHAMITTPEYVEAQKKFEQSLADSTSAMSNFLDTEAEQVETLTNLVSAQLSYYQDAARILQDLQDRLQNQLKRARDEAANRLSSSLEKQSFIDAISPDDAVSPKVELKPKYEGKLDQTPVCKAMFDFEAENPFELSFHEGDLLKLIEQVDDNWFLGELNGKQGHFPTTYVQVIVPLPA
jgi:endophilin-A